MRGRTFRRWRSGRLAGWLLAGGVVAGAGVVLEFLGDGTEPLAPWWLIVAGVVVAIFGALVPELRSMEQETVADKAAIRRSSRNPSDAGEWPKVADITAEQMGARRPLVEVGYLKRKMQGRVEELLAKGEPTVLVGPAMQGKSRLGAHVLRNTYGDRDLVWLHPSRIEDLLDRGRPEDSVVWLDDLESYLAAEDLRSDWVEILRSAGNVILATMRTAEWEKYDATDQVRLPESKILDAFTPVWVLFDLDEAEQLAASMPSAKHAAGVARYGLGEYLGGGPKYLKRYEAGHDTHPLGVTLVRAAVDLRRVGIDRVEPARLERLAPNYVRARTSVHRETVDDALTWALGPLESLPGLLEWAEPDGDHVRAGDFMLDHLPDTGLPGPVWDDIVSDPPASGPELNAVAVSALNRGRPQVAATLFEKTLADQEHLLGPNHPDTLSSRNNLACAYESAGNLERAIPLFEQTLADRLRVLGPEHPDTLGSRNNLAGAYESAGNLERAIPLHEQTLADFERVLGPEHPNTLTSRNNLAYAYESAGNLERAIPLYEQTLADSERVLGPEHPDTLTSRNNLAYAYESAGNPERAIPLYEQTLADRLRVLGPEHPNTLTSRNNLAYAYESAGNLERAIPLYEQTLADFVRVLGPEHPDTVSIRVRLRSARSSSR